MEKEKLIKLVRVYCIPCNKISSFSSYALKSVFEKIAGCYISDAEMRAAFEAAGYKAYRHNRYKLMFVDAPEIPTEFITHRKGVQGNGRI